MSTPIDIYTYPENATPIQLAEYQLEVMRAAERGEPVEWAMDSKDGYCGTPDPTWDWSEGCRYRIARPKIAEGHNPDKLTEAQVGVQDGWRLLSEEERSANYDGRNGHPTFKDEIECWVNNHWDASGYCGDGTTRTYRTKNPPGHYLPKPAAEPVAETREETRRDRIATIVQLIRNGSETAEQIAARIEAMLAREIRPAVQGGAE